MELAQKVQAKPFLQLVAANLLSKTSEPEIVQFMIYPTSATIRMFDTYSLFLNVVLSVSAAQANKNITKLIII